ncbi:MAG: DMT family transporter [Thiogranum sp.]|nr:DMT family transporter [Thiogranum sp.]
MTADNPARGALLVTAAALMFASMGVLIRFATQQLPNEQVVFLRNFFGLLILLPLLLRNGIGASLRTDRLALHVVRSLCGLAAMYCFFYALANLALADAVLLNFTAPLFIPFIALLWLRETVSRQVIAAIVIGFAGILLVLKPGLGVFNPAALVGLASGVFAAIAMVSLRTLSATDPPLRVVIYYGIICTSVSAVPMLWAWQPAPLETFLQLAGAGAFATAGQYLLSRGYGYAPAAQIGPFTYTSVVFAATYGWLFWKEMPDWLSASGTVLIVIAGALAMQKTRAASSIA